MGLKSWLIKHFFSKDIPASRIKQELEKSKFDVALDEYLITSQKRHQEALRTADKLMKGKLMQQQSREIIQDIQDLDAEQEEKQEKAPTTEDQITSKIIESLLTAPPKPQQNPDPFADPNQPPTLPDPAVAAAAPQADASALRQAAQEKIKNLSEQELKDLKAAGFI